MLNNGLCTQPLVLSHCEVSKMRPHYTIWLASVPWKSHPWQEMNMHCRHLRPFSADPHHLLWPCERMCLSTKKKLPTGSASDKCCSCLSLLLQFSNTYVAPTSGLYNLISITHKKKKLGSKMDTNQALSGFVSLCLCTTHQPGNKYWPHFPQFTRHR